MKQHKKRGEVQKHPPQDDMNALQRVISGELRTTINAHGEIGPDEIGSATKRIAGQLYATFYVNRRTPQVRAPGRPKAEIPENLVATN